MFEIATPWAFLLLPLPWILWKKAPPCKITFKTGLRIPFYAQLKKMAFPPQMLPLSKWFFASWIFLTLALSGPQWVGPPQPLQQQGHPIMMALDVSGSMAIEDMVIQQHRMSRFDVVRYAAQEFVKQRAGDKIGLILFGSRAYLQTPLTYDRSTLLSQLNDASVGLAGQATALGDAITLSIKHLTSHPIQQGILILLTDGANNAGLLSPQKATAIAKKHHIKIYTIGLSQDPSQRSLFQLMAPQNDLDEQTLQSIAKETQGHYFRATNPQSLIHIYKLINQMEYKTKDALTKRPKKEYYPWPLSIGFICCLFGILNHYRTKR